MTARILVVEDEFFIAQEIAEAIAQAGLEVVGPFSRVAAALARLREGPACNAAVLDVSLRNEDSLPVALALEASGIPYIVVTGFSADQIPRDMTAAQVLAKPANARDLIGAIRALLPSF